MRVLIVFLAAPVLFAQPPQTPAPVYARESIVPLPSNAAKLLAPGMAVELYGAHLAPEPWCGQNATPPAPYPVEVCGVRVMVGSSPAELMFVGPGQINFRIPAGAPAEGPAPIQVCVRGVCGAPVMMQFSAHTAFLRLRGAAAVHMPVWIQIDAPPPYQVKYPCGDTPWSFDGYQFEVRRNGQLLSQQPPPKDALGHAAMAIGPGSCAAAAQPSALPLHLLYQFDQPGVYSLRFTAIAPAGPNQGTTTCQSQWTDIAVDPYSASQRDEWLQSMAEQVKSASPQTLMADVIPSLLAWPDDKALTVLLPLLDQTAYAGQFARYSLAAFNDDVLRRVLPPDRLLSLCPPNGRCRIEN